MTAIHSRDSRQSFDVMKFKKIRDQLIKDRVIRRKDVLKAPRLSEEDLLLVHTREYLNRLKNPMYVGEILNLDYVNPWDEYIFEYFRYVAGGTVLATEYTLEHGNPVFNLGGGYHHAHPDRAEGFCLINDVAIAIRKMQLRGKLGRVLIVDLDYHQGNGNLLFFRDDESVFTFSIHAENWVDCTRKINNVDIELPSHVKDEEYLRVLREHLPGVFETFRPEFVMYLAGSDPYVLDSIGDFDISEEGMLERDKFVFSLTRSRKLPMVILGAGGYGPESWKVYYNFIKWAMKKGK
jgi:acetoin utilization deacetylase AcuC-like enzyme